MTSSMEERVAAVNPVRETSSSISVGSWPNACHKPLGSPSGDSVSIEGDDGVRYYGSHLSKVQSGIKPGVRVKAGQLLGLTGKTGNSSGVCHVHYGISPPCAKTGDWKVRRGVVWPYTYLASWRKGGQKSPVATVASWKKDSGWKA